MTLGVRGLVVDEQGRALLVRHTYVEGYYLPGGGVEPGETLEEALTRELMEEGNVLLEQPAALHKVYLNRSASPRDHVALFVIRQFRQTGPYVPNREIAEAAFFPLDALPDGATNATRARLNEILQGGPTSPYW
ncbi:NUDIX domain-containing protein [Methylocystis heyeri]|uniref:NUDIX domain-containing protein n=2 Tax=Methylocystis heyeri TaxID=391905 RepID=A0A6B8KK61_9HYPH|nr:NUDIX domain-containing protein [Methylocystis heyeri]